MRIFLLQKIDIQLKKTLYYFLHFCVILLPALHYWDKNKVWYIGKLVKVRW